MALAQSWGQPARVCVQATLKTLGFSLRTDVEAPGGLTPQALAPRLTAWPTRRVAKDASTSC
jgi:hypothetical protein